LESLMYYVEFQEMALGLRRG